MWSKIMYANTKKLKPGLSGKKLVAAQIWEQIWQNQNIFIMTELQMAIYKVTVGPGLYKCFISSYHKKYRKDYFPGNV